MLTTRVLLASATSLALSGAFVSAASQDQGSTPSTDRYAAARDVLERRCLECHGGDRRNSDLSFADHATFEHGGSRGPVIDGAELAKSRLLSVVEYGDPSLAMPPSGVLPAEEREALRLWILDGAHWPTDESGVLADASAHPLEHARPQADGPWWAYDPLGLPESPSVRDGGWSAHPVDAFVRAGLDARQLAPAAAANPEALLRRASFDLTGLPPSADERRAFLDDVDARGQDAAWSTLLDRLFASPHYGEAQARHWLDLVRYAETNGYERDSQKKNMWRYRDWVVRAFDADMPYDEFVQLQLAGDEYALGMKSEYDAAEARIATGFHRLGIWDDEPVDRAQALSDQRADIVDTFSQVAFATTMGCARCHDHKADPVTQREYFELTAHFTGVTGFRLDGHRPIADRPADGVLTVAQFDAKNAAAEAEIAKAARAAGLDAPLEGEVPATLVADARERPQEWAYLLGEFDGEAWAAPSFDDAEWKRGMGGFGAPGTPKSIIGTRWHAPFLRLRTTFRLDELPRALALSVHYDDDVVVYLNGTRIFERTGYVVDYGSYQLGPEALDALVVGRNVLAVSCLQDFGGQYIDVGLRSGFDTRAEGSWLAAAETAAREASDDPLRVALGTRVADRNRLLTSPVASPYPAHVVTERGIEPPQQHIELRGSVHALDDAVMPSLPAAWTKGSSPDAKPYVVAAPPDGATSSFRRQALAEWAFDGGAHVTARVEANRLWQFLFGSGLCRTPGDFGRLGETPRNAKLLDRIAAELVARNWSRKAVQRWLMESQAYRMASTGAPEAFAADPRNDGIWRYEPRKLTAEEFRDAALATSGELNLTRYGPWTYPPLAAEVLATSSRPNAAWGKSSEADAVRRSLYVHVKRSMREPLLAAMDQPDPDLPCAARFPTNVPTQALLTLNGTFIQARARALAASLQAEFASPRERLAAAIERTFSRAATSEDVDRALAFLDELQGADGMDAAPALELFCLGLFNRNEFLWID